MTIEKNTKPEVRVRRTPLAARKKLSVDNQDPNYHYRVVNVVDGRTEDFIDRGYEIVPAKVGDKRVDSAAPIGSQSQISVGGGTKAVVMRIRKDWYEEDQAFKQSQIDSLEADMNNAAKKGI